jgi:T4 bacteriophage base plate protein
MRMLSAVELLDVWERGLTQSPVERALTVLAAACTEASIEALAQLSIGQRDGLLLTLREWTFGPQFVSLTTCPTCSERLELTVDAMDLRVKAQSTAESELRVANYVVHFRLPNSLDLIALSRGENLTTVRRLLLKRCLLQVQSDGADASAEELPIEVIDAIVARMAEADPQADMRLALTCPQCGHQWRAAFDIAAFFWREIEDWAERTLREVHILASRYGWREMDILAISPWRRQWYLNLVNT